MEDQLQHRIQLFLQEQRRGRGTRTDGSGLVLGTTIGSVRNENQDRAIVVAGRYSAAPERNFILGALCDGMGGMAQGEHAAVISLSTFVARVLRHGRTLPHDRLSQAAGFANRIVHSELRGSGGATLTAVLVDANGKATGINVGDSRLYHIIHDEVRQVSRDDTLGEYLRSERGEAHLTDHRREILQFVGIGDGFEPHILNIPASNSEELFLLTSDGAHDVPNEVFNRIITSGISRTDIVKKLLELADLMGGRDNATVVAVPHYPHAPSAYFEPLPDVGMTFCLWSPFDEFEIWIPTGFERFQDSPAEMQRDQPAILDKRLQLVPDDAEATKRSHSAGKRKRPRRKSSKRDTDDAGSERPRLDIDFPDTE